MLVRYVSDLFIVNPPSSQNRPSLFCNNPHRRREKLGVAVRESLRDFRPSPLQQIRLKTMENSNEMDSRLGTYSHQMDPNWTMDGDSSVHRPACWWTSLLQHWNNIHLLQNQHWNNNKNLNVFLFHHDVVMQKSDVSNSWFWMSRTMRLWNFEILDGVNGACPSFKNHVTSTHFLATSISA